MNLLKAGEFIAEVEKQYEWYFEKAGVEVADGYLDAVAATCQLLARQPLIGPRSSFKHSRLRG